MEENEVKGKKKRSIIETFILAVAALVAVTAALLLFLFYTLGFGVFITKTDY